MLVRRGQFNSNCIALSGTDNQRRMLEDVEHFRAKLGKIQGASEVGDKLIELVKAKPIAPAPAEAEKTESTSEKQTQDKGSESAET